MSKPNGLEIGTIVISIDDGFVEYAYQVKPKEDINCSIGEIHRLICRILGAEETKGEIRTEHTDEESYLTDQLTRLQSELEEARKEIERLIICRKLLVEERAATYKILKKHNLTNDSVCLDTMLEDAILKLKNSNG
jgi:predicted transcriptional regulator